MYKKHPFNDSMCIEILHIRSREKIYDMSFDVRQMAYSSKQWVIESYREMMIFDNACTVILSPYPDYKEFEQDVLTMIKKYYDQEGIKEVNE